MGFVGLVVEVLIFKPKSWSSIPAGIIFLHDTLSVFPSISSAE